MEYCLGEMTPSPAADRRYDSYLIARLNDDMVAIIAVVFGILYIDILQIDCQRTAVQHFLCDARISGLKQRIKPLEW